MAPGLDSRNPGAGRRRFEVVVVAASAGGVLALRQLLSHLPPDFPLPIAVVQHRTGAHPGMLAHVLGRHSALAVKDAENGEIMQPGTVYLAPANLHMRIRRDRSVAFTNGRRIRHARSSADPLFQSAAETLPGKVIAVVLTGYDGDGSDGALAVKEHGGVVIAQDEITSLAFDMPRSAILTGAVDHVLPLAGISRELIRLARIRA